MNNHRYASAERYYEALDILESGACIQLEKGQVILFVVKNFPCYRMRSPYFLLKMLSLDILHLQYFQVTCGAELAILFVETLVKGKFPYDDNTLGQSSLLM
ncbi:hypothetical protein CK203_111202 [Vitis vinifera]|uniref:Uncharacterized protein n=1 Tax=Vitis vinifera TaxID=29760 RepID=A0A438CGR2_VITVI|nr:hypothetical protein CK203_111202 [Vitis vinifera]